MTTLATRSPHTYRALMILTLLGLALGCKKSEEETSKQAGKKPKAEEREVAKEKAEPSEEDVKAPQPKAEEAVVSKVLAKVGGIEITEAVVEKELERNASAKQLPPAQLEARKKAVLQMLVNDALIRVACEKESLFVSPEELQAERVRRVQEAGGEEKFQKGLQSRRLSEEEAMEIIRSTLLSQKLVAKRKPFAVDDEIVRKEYDRQKALPKKGPQVKISEIFFPVAGTAAIAMWDETKATATKVMDDIKQGKISFADAAKKFSKGPTAAKGGSQASWAGQKRNPQELYAPAFELPVGTVFGPIKTKRGIYIGRVDEKRDSPLGDFEKEKGNIRAVLEKNAYDKNLREVLDGLTTEFPVQYNQ